jgi:hypothetical protein
MEAVYNELSKRGVVELKEMEDGQECYDLAAFPVLSALIIKKLTKSWFGNMKLKNQKEIEVMIKLILN